MAKLGHRGHAFVSCNGSTPAGRVQLYRSINALTALIQATLHASSRNKQATASQLGITRRTLYQKLSRYEQSKP